MSDAAANPDQEVSPRPATFLMIATYVVGGIGIFIAFNELNGEPPSLSTAALLAVGGAGLLSFVRHSIFHESDAARLGWGIGRRNNFQIEVGLANLAWGVLAILAVALDWGLAVEAASFLVFGFYITSVGVMLLVTPATDRTRPWRQVILMWLFGIMLLWIGFAGMAAV